MFSTKLYYFYFIFREVFKAREISNPKKFVAMKKVLMDNEKEGVGMVPVNSFQIECFFLVSNYGTKGN